MPHAVLRAVALALRLLPFALRCALRLAPFAPAMAVALFSFGFVGFALAQASIALLCALGGRPVLGRTTGPQEEWATFASMGLCVSAGAAVMLRWWWADLKQSDEGVRALCQAVETQRTAR